MGVGECVSTTSILIEMPKGLLSAHEDRLLVDATSGHELLSFMDAFSRYNQIKMALEDQERIAFITN